MTTVLFDLSTLAAGSRLRGIGRYAAELALGLGRAAPSDLRLRFLEEFAWPARARITDDPAAAIERLTRPDRPIMAQSNWTMRVRVGLSLAARRVGADLVHVPHTDATPLLKFGSRRIVTCHDLIPLRFPNHYLSRGDGYRLGRRLRDGRRYRTSDHIIAISEATAQDLQRMLGVSPDKITVVHHGIDHDQWSPKGDDVADDAALAPLPLPPRPFLLCVGAADWRKNHARMFDALGLARRDGADVDLVWVGHHDPHTLRRLHHDAARFGISDHVHLIGYTPDAALKALYRRALATMFISLCEGFGYPVLEGMAIGCPVITSAHSSMGEIGAGGAVLVDPERPDQMAEAIYRVATDPAWRSEVRRQGIERASIFTRTRQVQQTLAAYRRVAAPATGR